MFFIKNKLMFIICFILLFLYGCGVGMQILTMAKSKEFALIVAIAQYDVAQAENLIKSDKKLVNSICQDCDNLAKSKKWVDTPLMYALFGDKKMVAFLLEHGADPNLGNAFFGFTPLFRASRWLFYTQLLCEYGADVNQPADFMTPLMSAAEYNDIEVVDFLIQNNADVNYKSPSGETALFYAVLSKSGFESLKLLLENGADTTIRDNKGRTAIDLAKAYLDEEGEYVRISYDHLRWEAINIIKDFQNSSTSEYECGALLQTMPLTKSKEQALIWAINKNDITRVENLIKSDKKLVNSICQDCDNLTIRKRWDDTPLMYAIRRKGKEMITLLLEHGADPDLENAFGFTPLSRASSMPLNFTKLLCKYKADVNKPGFFKTPLMSAAEINNTEVVDFLIQNNADINYKVSNGQTALFYAVISDSGFESLELLLENGVDTTIRDNQGRTAIDHAETYTKGLRLIYKDYKNRRDRILKEAIKIIKESRKNNTSRQ